MCVCGVCVCGVCVCVVCVCGVCECGVWLTVAIHMNVYLSITFTVVRG